MFATMSPLIVLVRRGGSSQPVRRERLLNRKGTTMTTTAGYSYGRTTLAPSPVTMRELEELQSSVLWSEDDVASLRDAAKILIPQTEAILDVWYGFVGANPHLVATFAGADGQPNPEYLAAVRRRFAAWIADVCLRPFDQEWLDYQEEIGRRHHPSGKNRTDGVASTSPHIPMRHLIALIVPITMTIRGFLANGDASPEQIDAMYSAWFKAVTLSAVLWTRLYSEQLW